MQKKKQYCHWLSKHELRQLRKNLVEVELNKRYLQRVKANKADSFVHTFATYCGILTTPQKTVADFASMRLLRGGLNWLKRLP